jgi:hypothetical protein
MNYLEIPLLVKWTIHSSLSDYGFYAGPTLAFRVGVGGTIENTGEDFSDADKDYLNKYTSFFDWGIALGATVEKKIGPGKFIIDARGTLGIPSINTLSDFQKSQGVSENALVKDKNLVISIMAGYAWAIKTPSFFYK